RGRGLVESDASRRRGGDEVTRGLAQGQGKGGGRWNPHEFVVGNDLEGGGGGGDGGRGVAACGGGMVGRAARSCARPCPGGSTGRSCRVLRRSLPARGGRRRL